MNANQPRYEILKDSYREMQSQMEEQFLHAAIAQVESFLKFEPGHATAHNDLGVFYYRKGDKLQALGHYQKANRFAPENAVFKKSLAYFYLHEMGWNDEAAELYQEIVRSSPTDIEGLIALATLNSASGNPEQARAWFDKVLQLHGGAVGTPAAEKPQESPLPAAPQPPAPKSGSELYRQSCDFAAIGKDADAIASLEELLQRDPGHALAHNDLGVLYLRTGNRAAALEQQQLAVTLDRSSASFAKNLAGLYLDEGMLDEAIMALVDLEKRHPEDIEALTALGNISLTVGHPEAAETFYERVLVLEPWNKTARDAVAALNLPPAAPMADNQLQMPTQTPDLDDLLARLRVQISPTENSETLYQRALTLANAGDIEGALSQLEALLLKDPKHAAAHNDLGVLYYQKGDTARAIEYHRQAVALSPGNLTYVKNLAGLYLADNATQDEGIFLLTDLIKTHPGDIETLYTLGSLCLNLGHSEQSGIFLRRLLEIEPWNQEARDLLQLSEQAAA